tara:strand:- start:22022 stop:23083 length:1062 start_codon:yes stop_codon:yes gene_type:complete
MKISFILPCVIRIPIGGAKVVYQYAEKFAKRGHEVNIIAPRSEGYQFRDLMKVSAVKMRDWWHGIDDQPYYPTPNGVEYIEIPAPDPSFIPDADAIIATGWQTAYWVDILPDSKGKKFYYIQNLETYQGDEKIIFDTWKLPLKKIVISGWLKEKANEIKEEAFGPIPNAVNSKEFYITNRFENRSKSILMHYHRLPIKGGNEGIKALTELKKMIPDLVATVFCSRKPFCSTPKWINLEIRPTADRLRNIYNNSSVFIHTSHQEGWGLPPMEAMASGCPVVAFKNEGILEYISEGKSGLLVKVGDTSELIKSAVKLLTDRNLRIKIAEEGVKSVKQYSWEKSAEQFEKILLEQA